MFLCICCKAERQINVLTKLHSVLDEQDRLAIVWHNTLVWHFCGIKCSQKMKKIQEIKICL